MKTNNELTKQLELPMKHISDVHNCFELCKTKDDVEKVLGYIPRMFGSFFADYCDDGEYIKCTITNIYDDEIDKVDYYLEREENDGE